MAVQLRDLDALSKERAETKRDLEKLHYSIKDFKRAIDRYREESAKLEEEKEVLVDRVSELEALIQKRSEEINEMESYLADKERVIQQMESYLKSMGQTQPQTTATLAPKFKGDLLDEMIGQYITQANCPVPIKKLGNGYYIFGTRKIYAKILNGKLVIRVGGGYMIIEEFINTYAEQELNKINKIQEQQQMLEDEDDIESLDISAATRSKDLYILNCLGRSGSGRGSIKSPRSSGAGGAQSVQHSISAASLVTGTVDGSISGTNRNKRITQKVLDRIHNDPRAGRYIENQN